MWHGAKQPRPVVAIQRFELKASRNFKEGDVDLVAIDSNSEAIRPTQAIRS